MRITSHNVSIIADIYDRLTNIWTEIKELNDIASTLKDYGARDISELKNALRSLDKNSAILYLKVLDIYTQVNGLDNKTEQAVDMVTDILNTLEDRL